MKTNKPKVQKPHLFTVIATTAIIDYTIMAILYKLTTDEIFKIRHLGLLPLLLLIVVTLAFVFGLFFFYKVLRPSVVKVLEKISGKNYQRMITKIKRGK